MDKSRTEIYKVSWSKTILFLVMGFSLVLINLFQLNRIAELDQKFLGQYSSYIGLHEQYTFFDQGNVAVE